MPPDVNTMSIVNEEKGRKGISKCWERERRGDTNLYYSEGRLALQSHSHDTNAGMGMVPLLDIGLLFWLLSRVICETHS